MVSEFHLIISELVEFDQAADGRLIADLENKNWIFSEKCLGSFLEKQSLGDDIYEDLKEVQDRRLCMLSQCFDKAKYIMGVALCGQHYDLLTSVTPVTDKMTER